MESRGRAGEQLCRELQVTISGWSMVLIYPISPSSWRLECFESAAVLPSELASSKAFSNLASMGSHLDLVARKSSEFVITRVGSWGNLDVDMGCTWPAPDDITGKCQHEQPKVTSSLGPTCFSTFYWGHLIRICALVQQDINNLSDGVNQR